MEYTCGQPFERGEEQKINDRGLTRQGVTQRNPSASDNELPLHLPLLFSLPPPLPFALW